MRFFVLVHRLISSDTRYLILMSHVLNRGYQLWLIVYATARWLHVEAEPAPHVPIDGLAHLQLCFWPVQISRNWRLSSSDLMGRLILIRPEHANLERRVGVREWERRGCFWYVRWFITKMEWLYHWACLSPLRPLWRGLGMPMLYP